MSLRATDPEQYDSTDLDWTVAGAENSPSRIYFRKELDSFIEPGSLKGKRVLDIGCGVGHLFNWLKDKGASEVFGFDPSSRNVETCQKLYPWAHSSKATLHEFAQTRTEKFDVAFAVMVFEHIIDVREAFQDIFSLLKEGGRFYLIIGDKDFHISSDKRLRGDVFVSVEILKELGEGTIETRTVRESKGMRTIMHDIFRPLSKVEEVAISAGLVLQEKKDLIRINDVPDAELMVPACYLLVFRKSSE